MERLWLPSPTLFQVTSFGKRGMLGTRKRLCGKALTNPLYPLWLDMQKRVIFYLSHEAYAPYLLTSIYTLRRYWSGMVDVYAWPGSYAVAHAMSMFRDIRAKVIKTDPVYSGGKNGQYIQKIDILSQSPGVSLLLDADTLVNGDISPLLDTAEAHGMSVTNFCDWKSNKGVISKRLERMKPFLNKQELVWLSYVMTHPLSSPNVGVIASDSKSPVLAEWRELAGRVSTVFIPDECAMHLLAYRFGVLSNQLAIMPGTYNCSPKYKPEAWADEEVKVWHGHGNMWAKPKKSLKGHEMWVSVFRECAHIGGMSTLYPHMGNGALTESLKEMVF